VLDLTDVHAGTLTTMFLADYGADVVCAATGGALAGEDASAVRPPAAHLVWDRNKRLADAGRQNAIATLAATADVIVESARPGKMPPAVRLDDVRKRNPALIWCSITPYGPDGPLAAKPGCEGLVAARSGIMTEQRGRDGEPVFNALPLASIGTALLAINGILAALHHRSVTGVGQRVETSMYQGSLAARSPMLVRGQGVQTWDSAGQDPQGALPNYRLYRCADDRWLHLGALIPVFWDKLVIALDLYEFATDPRFETAPLYWPTEEVRAEAKRILAAKFATAPRDHWLKVLRDGDVPASPATPTHELFDHPQVVANGLATVIDDPRVGRLDQGMPPVSLSLTPGSVRRPAPHGGSLAVSWESRQRFHRGRLPLSAAPRPRQAADTSTGVSTSVSPGTPAATFAGAPAGTPARAAAGPSAGPLAGLRVLDLSSYLAGPLGPAYLADLGADVIKVEPPAGEGCRMIMMLFLGGNAGKRGLALDLKRPASREVLHRLIEQSDVVVHNNRVGVAERLGIDYESVRRVRPDVVYVQSTAYGSRGPDASLPGFDPLFQSLTGIGLAQAGPGRPPVFPKTPICDIATAMLGAAAALLGIAHRDRTGEGQFVETSLLATGLWLRSDAFVRYAGATPPVVTNEDNSGTHAAHRWYRARDGYLFVGCNSGLGEGGVDAARLCEVVGVPPGPARARAGREGDREIAARLAVVIRTRSVADWLNTFAKSGIPAERVADDNDEGVYRNPQALHLGALAHDPYPGYRAVVQPGILIGFSKTPARRRAGSPVVGQHTREIMAGLGYSKPEMERLAAGGVIAFGDPVGA
jgi:crotonobetainyl-CoA:carnitine CoA-transferase CaiB-like acyl-CoA transferase